MRPPVLDRPTAAIFNDTSGHRHHGCDLVMRELKSGLASHGIDCIWTEPRGESSLEAAEEALRALAPGIVVVNGEGTIHHTADRPAASHLCRIGGLARRLGVPSVLLNATVQSVDEASAKALRDFDAVYVRETPSRDELRQFGIEATIVPDLVFRHTVAHGRERSGVLGIDSVLPQVSAAIEAHFSAMGWPFRRIKALKLGHGVAESIDQFCDLLAAKSLVATGRFHGVALCVVTGTPFVAIESNTHKISGLLRDIFGNADRLMAPEAIPSIRDGESMPWTPAELRAIADFLAAARAGMARMFGETERLARRRMMPD